MVLFQKNQINKQFVFEKAPFFCCNYACITYDLILKLPKAYYLRIRTPEGFACGLILLQRGRRSHTATIRRWRDNFKSQFL